MDLIPVYCLRCHVRNFDNMFGEVLIHQNWTKFMCFSWLCHVSDGLCAVQACSVCLHVASFLHCFHSVTGALWLFTAVPVLIISKKSNQAPTIAQSIEHVFKSLIFKIKYFCTKHFICIQYFECMSHVHERMSHVTHKFWVLKPGLVTWPAFFFSKQTIIYLEIAFTLLKYFLLDSNLGQWLA